MRHLVAATRVAVRQQNWYAALTMALTMPDICGKLESPTAGSGSRYKAWCKTYLEPRYTRVDGAVSHVFLTAGDAYALRCAVLHEGSDEIVEQRAREALTRFQFIEPPQHGRVHCNQVNSKLQLQVDVFCEDVCQGVTDWYEAVGSKDLNVRVRIGHLMTIGHSTRF